MTSAEPVPVEYLHGIKDCLGSLDCGWMYFDADDPDRPDHWDYHLVTYRISRKTPKRIYFLAPWETEMFVDRQTIETTGSVWHRGVGNQLYLEAQQPEPPWRRPATLPELRRAMADAHPDRGGSEPEFTAARMRYVAAREKSSA